MKLPPRCLSIILLATTTLSACVKPPADPDDSEDVTATTSGPVGAGGQGGSGSTSGSGASGGASELQPLEAATEFDLVFRGTGASGIAGDLYLPARTDPVPAVLVIHGGGFITGDKAGAPEVLWSEHLTANGFAAFSVNYRLIGDFPPGEIPFSGAIMDLKCAVRWLRGHAESLRIDPNRIYALGGSAGGFMANFLGTTGDEPEFSPEDCVEGSASSDRLQAFVAYYGPSDWNALYNDPLRLGADNGDAKFLGLDTTAPCAPGSAESSGICTVASATTYVDPEDPPAFLAHSDDDPTIPLTQSELMRATLEAAGVDVNYQQVDGLGHGWHAKFGNDMAVGVRDEAVAFLGAQGE